MLILLQNAGVRKKARVISYNKSILTCSLLTKFPKPFQQVAVLSCWRLRSRGAILFVSWVWSSFSGVPILRPFSILGLHERTLFLPHSHTVYNNWEVSIWETWSALLGNAIKTNRNHANKDFQIQVTE